MSDNDIFLNALTNEITNNIQNKTVNEENLIVFPTAGYFTSRFLIKH